jgi:beta-glucuronidase
MRPRETPTREIRPLNGLWRFALDADGTGRREQWWSRRLPGEIEMPVPASFNEIVPDPEVRDHVGDLWYQRDVRVPRGWDERIVLRLDSATHRATVWVGDAEVVSHEGGYTPFEADVTAHLTPGEEARITVAVSNELNWRSIPPGYVEELEDGRRRQQYFHDFFNFAGLHRSVWLYSAPAVHIETITVDTTLDGAAGVVDYAVEIGGGGGHDVRVALRDAAGEEVATADGAEGSLRVEDVHQWQPGEGYLYELGVHDNEGSLVDSYPQPVGVRTVAVDGQRFLINGRPFYFTGFGMHEDAPVRGKGHDDPLMVHDFELLRWIGANSLRTSHYPYAEEVLDYADRHGIVVIDETAAVGLNLNVGGGILNQGEPLTTYTEETISDGTREVHMEAIRELIARDRNHPCVVIWSIANEPDSIQPEARDYFEPLVRETRRLDPTRPVGFANFMLATPERCVISDLFDVLMLNRYYGWYTDTGDLTAAEAKLDDELRRWTEKYDKPIVFTEYGADTQPGLHSVNAEPWTEAFQRDYLEVYHRVFDRFDAVVGEQIWHFADFATRTGITRVDGNKKGVFTRDRRPKASAHELRRRWHEIGGR